MGRKPIPPNQRAQPISFSLKPHLIEKIDDYCHDHRFNRSKFLMEAVTQYMLKNDMGYHSDTNVMEMSIERRVVVGLSALQEANREGELIPKPIMDALRRELGLNDQESIDAQEDNPRGSKIDEEEFREIMKDLDEKPSFHKVKDASVTTETVTLAGQTIGMIQRNPNFSRKWNVILNGEMKGMANTLKDAREWFRNGKPLVGV